MNVLEVDEFFAHHGIKGQHWGIRNLKNRKVGNLKQLSAQDKLRIANMLSGAVIGNIVGVLVADVLKEKGTKPIVTAIGTTLVSFGAGAAVKALLTVGEKKIIEIRTNRINKKIKK